MRSEAAYIARVRVDGFLHPMCESEPVVSKSLMKNLVI